MTKKAKPAKNIDKAKKAPASAAAGKRAPVAGGCCTLIGEGPDEQHEGLTREECRLLAAERNRNFQWVPGRCAEPD
jgi:hypothetical protein